MVTFSKLEKWALPNSATFCGITLLQDGSSKSHVWSVQCINFLASIWEKCKNKNLAIKDQLISDLHSNWQVSNENAIK